MNTEALIKLWNVTQKHPGTSGARVAAGVLLGLYNGDRFPFTLTDLRLLDSDLTTTAIDVIQSDARRCEKEVHRWLNDLTGRSDFQPRIESLAHEYSVKGRCRRSELPSVSPARVGSDPFQAPRSGAWNDFIQGRAACGQMRSADCSASPGIYC